MEPHNIELPKYIRIGNNILSEVNDLLEKLNFKGSGNQRVLLLSGSKTFGIAGKQVKEELEDKGFEMDVEIISSVDHYELEKILRRRADVDLIISVGGGKIIDTGKFVSTEKNIPFISVPTAPSHDGISSTRATISKENRKYSYKSNAPAAVLADVEIIKNAPYDLISAGCGDIVSNLTAVEDWKLAAKYKGEYYSDYAVSLSTLASEITMKFTDSIKQREEKGIRNLVKALISAGISMSIAGSSRPCSGSEHAFSHALDSIAEKPMVHGHQCALGTPPSACLHGIDWKKIREFMEKVGIPNRLEDTSFTEEELLAAWKEAKNIRNRYTILNKNNENPEKLFKKVGIL